jgi:hypothetical protein
MNFVAKAAGETYLGCSGARRARACQSRTLFNYALTERRVLSAISELREDETSGRVPSLDPCSSVRATAVELGSRLTLLLNEFRSDSTPEIVAAIRQVRSEREAADAELRSCEEGAAVARFAPTLGGLHEALGRLVPLFGSDDEPFVYSARAEVAQCFRWIGLTLRFLPHTRATELHIGETRHRVDLHIRPDFSRASRDPTTGRFTGKLGA